MTVSDGVSPSPKAIGQSRLGPIPLIPPLVAAISQNETRSEITRMAAKAYFDLCSGVDTVF